MVQFRRVIASLIVAVGLVGVSVLGLATPSYAAVGTGNGVQTPAGIVFVTTSATNVVTVSLIPTPPNIFVFGDPFATSPTPPNIVPGFTRTLIPAGSGGTVAVDTIIPTPPNIVPSPPDIFPGFSLPTLVIISIQAPTRDRVSTVGTTVTFIPSPPQI